MAIAQVTAGNRIVTTDVNQFYNLLKGVAASGEGITLIYNTTGVVVLQPSSDPSAGTEFIQIKNNAGTTLGALSSDGKTFAGDGTAALPGLTFELNKNTGLYRSATNTLDFTTGGTRRMSLASTGLAMSAPLLQAKGADIASGSTITPGADGDYFHVTGTTTVTAIATAQAGRVVYLEFDGIVILTYNATSLILQGSANYTTAAGDMFTFISEGSGNWRELSRRPATAAASVTSFNNTITSAVAVTSGTWTDVCTLSLAAGTYFIIAQLNWDKNSQVASTVMGGRIQNTTDAASLSSGEWKSDGSSSDKTLMTMQCAVVLSGTKTIKSQAIANQTSILVNAANVVNGTGNVSTQLTALKIA